MAGKHRTDKHRKQRKKELANRKAKKGQILEVVDDLSGKWKQTQEQVAKEIIDAPSMSPARRAFQDV